MGCPPSFLVSRVALLLKKIGTGETETRTSFPVCSCANSAVCAAARGVVLDFRVHVLSTGEASVQQKLLDGELILDFWCRTVAFRDLQAASGTQAWAPTVRVTSQPGRLGVRVGRWFTQRDSVRRIWLGLDCAPRAGLGPWPQATDAGARAGGHRDWACQAEWPSGSEFLSLRTRRAAAAVSPCSRLGSMALLLLPAAVADSESDVT